MSRPTISSKQVEQVVRLYTNNPSILDVAQTTGFSTVKVRKILITEGLWESETSIAIGRLLREGLTTEQIANRLYMSVKNVQAYMPYERGLYKSEDPTQEAIRSDMYRKRMKQAAVMQVRSKMDLSELGTEGMQMSKNEGIFTAKIENAKISKVLRLHCELTMDGLSEEDLEVLKRYGSMKRSFSRDILVPVDITLHALHYAILRLFGWQNSHLHCYALPETVFDQLTEQRFWLWAQLAGVYFRFPSEDYEDLYWDDDYKEGQSFKSWMKRKYTGPYHYRGYAEHYLQNQLEVAYMFRKWPEITVREFPFEPKKQKDSYRIKLAEASVKEVEMAFTDVLCHELLERLPLSQVLRTPLTEKKDFKEIHEELFAKLSQVDVKRGWDILHTKEFKSVKKEQEFFNQYNTDVYPVTDQLLYRYDYGDGWEVAITCTGEYDLAESGGWNWADDKPMYVKEENLREVVTKHRPVCIAKDGIELLDDVGGIGGFCDMLLEIYAASPDIEGSMEIKEERLAWANMLGWTGRKIGIKTTL